MRKVPPSTIWYWGDLLFLSTARRLGHMLFEKGTLFSRTLAPGRDRREPPLWRGGFEIVGVFLLQKAGVDLVAGEMLFHHAAGLFRVPLL